MNNEVMQELRNAAKIQPGSRETFPSNLSGSIVPVIEVNPKLTKNCTTAFGAAVNATSGTVFSCPSDRDLYVTSATLSVIKDATATSTSSRVNVTVGGVAVALLSIVELTLTAQSNSISVSLPHPLKVDRGSTITVTNSTNVGNVSANATVQYFLDEQGNS